MLQFHFYPLPCLRTRALMSQHYFGDYRLLGIHLKNDCVVITDLFGYQQKSVKMKTRFHFLFLVIMSFVATAAGTHKRQG